MIYETPQQRADKTIAVEARTTVVVVVVIKACVCVFFVSVALRDRLLLRRKERKKNAQKGQSGVGHSLARSRPCAVHPKSHQALQAKSKSQVSVRSWAICTTFSIVSSTGLDCK